MLRQASQIKKIACVGAGTIGRSWAVLFAGKGIEVAVQDVSEDAVSLAEATVKSSFTELVKYRLLSESTARAAVKRISYRTGLEETVAGADYVQESVPESMALKKKLFREISSVARRDAILASSTGGFLMSKIQQVTSHPEKCLVVHPCQTPVHLTRLVELVPGRMTDSNTMRIARELMIRVGKKPIQLRSEVQDYITNRLQFTLWREALDIVGKRVASAEDIDMALCEMARASTCIGMGPFMQAHVHGGPHELGGIEAAMSYYSMILPDTWRSLAAWTRIPRTVLLNAQKSVRESVRKRGMSVEQLRRWRNRQLLSVARFVWCD